MNHGRALFIGNPVKRAADIALREDRLADLSRGKQRIEAHHPALPAHGSYIRPPFRKLTSEDMVCHPGGESFIQPDVIPPGWTHHVAEPLMRDLVSNGIGGGTP